MKKLLLQTIVLLLIPTLGFGQGWQWAKSYGGNQEDDGWGLTHDATGNLIQYGVYSDEADFGSVHLQSTLSYQAWYLMKTDANGQVLWAVNVLQGQNGFHQIVAVYAAADGNIYVAGEFTDTVTISSTAVSSHGYSDIFLACYNSNGIFQWVRSGGGVQTEELYEITGDNAGNVYVAGCYTEDASFDTVSLSSASTNLSDEAMLLAYNSSGNILYGKSFGGISSERATGIAYYNNALYLTGYFSSSTATFGSYSLNTANGGNDVFLAKLDLAGTVQWVKGFDNKMMSGAFLVRSPALQVNSSGIFMCVPFNDDITFDTILFTTNGSNVIAAIVGMDLSGNVEWAKKIDNRAMATFNDFEVEGNHVFLLGSFLDTLFFNGNQYFGNVGAFSMFENNSFVLSLNTDGDFEWIKMMLPYKLQTAVGTMLSGGLCANGNSVYVSGTYSDTVSLWPVYLAAVEQWTTNAFLAEIDITANEISENSGLNISVYPNPAQNEINVSNSFSSDCSFIIVDMNGNIAASGMIHSNEPVSVAHLNSGSYIFALKSGDKLYRTVFIKE